MSPRRGLWGTRFGFYLAAIGSAFGLGNLWRFPYVVAENGGGAFVLLYVFLVFLIGAPFLIGELILGKATRSSVVGAMKKLASADLKKHRDSSGPRKWLRQLGPLAGFFAVLLALVVLAYYAVISGWVLHFLMQFVASLIKTGPLQPNQALSTLLDNGWLQVALTSVHLLVAMVVVAKEVEDGLERWVGYMMPVFGVLLIILAARSLSMDTAPDALRFLLYPDFAKLTVDSFGQALGHVFFTLSIGFGAMVTFGSYLRDNAPAAIAGFRVATVDSLISVFAGLMIFPLVLASASPISGPELLFETVPALFAKIPGGLYFGIAFFLCLYLAALGASIGLLETVVANMRETFRLERSLATTWSTALCFVLAVVPALSSSLLSDVRFGDKGLLEILDGALINWLLPISALIISQAVAYMMEDAIKRQEFVDINNESELHTYRHWVVILRFVAAPVILMALLLQVIGALF